MKQPPPSRRKDRQCASCPTMIRRDNKSGFCNTCVKRQPEVRAKVAEAARNRTPEHREKLGEAQRRAHQRDPSLRERKSQFMRELALTPEWQERNRQQCIERRLWERGLAGRTALSNIRQGRTFSRRHGLARWCPEGELRFARELRRRGVPLDEVQRQVQQRHRTNVLRRSADEAARYVSLHDRCPVLRHEDGWRYGNGFRTSEEIVQMALRKGWAGHPDLAGLPSLGHQETGR